MVYSGILSLCVFMTIIVTSWSITCNRCWVNGGTECCKEETIQCTGDTCMTLTESCLVEGVPYAAIYKTCGCNLCDSCISITSENFVSRISTRCGTGNYSNAHLNFEKTCKSEPNGLKCPKCYNSRSMDGCEETGFAECSGNEEECVDYRGKVQFPDTTIHEVSLKGCVTKGACDLGISVIPGLKEWHKKLMICSEPQGKKL